MTAARQTAIGVSLSLLLMGTWLACHVYGVFFYDWSGAGPFVAPLLIAFICWLNVGLFIVAHDGMHGSLAPAAPRLNAWFGTVALGLYAGFRFGKLLPSHLAHHRNPGTADDPDFSASHPRHFWAWYREFLFRYFGWTELAILTAIVGLYLLIGAEMRDLLLFWALPAIASSLQLFYFGTYRPHRHEDGRFADDHRARSSGFGWLSSLLSCYHFGYHHEHHLAPHVPWWRLPGERRARASARSGRQPA